MSLTCWIQQQHSTDNPPKNSNQSPERSRFDPCGHIVPHLGGFNVNLMENHQRDLCTVLGSKCLLKLCSSLQQPHTHTVYIFNFWMKIRHQIRPLST